MAKKTGGHIRPCNVGSVEAHNERTEKYIENIKKAGMKIYFFPELSDRNDSWVSGNKRYKGKTCSEIFEAMKKRYTDVHGQAPQLKEKERVNKKTGRVKVIAGWSPIREMAVPIKADTKIEDFDYFKKWAENQGINIIRIDLHKDEGRRDDAGSVIENFHAHVVMDFLDWGRAKTINLGPDKMSEMQTILAISLGMERGEKKEDTEREYLNHVEYKKMMRAIDEKYAQLERINAEAKKAETRVKGLTTMVSNLQTKYDSLQRQYDELSHNIDIESSAYEYFQEKHEEDMESLRKQMEQLKMKIEERQMQLESAEDSLKEMNNRKGQAEKEYNELHPKFRKMQDAIKKMEDKQLTMESAIKEQTQFLQEQRKSIETEDRDSLVEKYREKAEAYQNYIFKRFPYGREAVNAIVESTVSTSANSFNPQQAMTINEAISWQGDDPAKKAVLAKNLMELAQPEFANRHGNVVGVNSKWIEQTAAEVLQIAEGTHPLSALLAEYHGQSAGGGGASYATDLTNWDGSRRKR